MIGFSAVRSCTQNSKTGRWKTFAFGRSAGEAQKVSEEAEASIQAVRPEQGLKRWHKNLLHACLAGTNEYVGSKQGEAAEKGAFDWSSPLHDGLRHTIGQGFRRAGR